MALNPNGENRNEEPLSSWKEIGAFIGRNDATARRWEKEEGLPVHRHSHKSRSSVYAYPSEIDAWRASRKVVPEPEPAKPLWKMPAFALTLALCLVMVGNGIRPQVASAQTPVARQVWNQEPYGPVSADGRYAPYGEWEAKGIGIHDFLTGTDRILGTGEVGELIVISPDNGQIVYQSFDGNLKRYVLRLLSLQSADQKPRNLMRGGPPNYIEPLGWTPDSKEVLVSQQAADGIWQIAMISVADGSVRVLKSLKWGKPGAGISPDGRFIVYSTPAEGQPNQDIFVLATDGSRETAVVQHPANDYGMIWSSDGSKVLFISDRTGAPSLWGVPVEEGKPAGPAEMVKDNFGASLLGMGRNGILYYYASGEIRNNVYRADLNADGKVSKSPVIVTDSFVNTNRGGHISPDGQSIAYYSYRPKATLVVKSLKTGAERVVPTSMGIVSPASIGPLWFSDSRSVLVRARENDRPGETYYRVDVATGRAEDISRGIAGRLFKPAHSGNVVYYRGEDGKGNLESLVRHDLDSGRSIKFLPTRSPFTFSESPDGKQVAYISSDGLETRWISIVPATGGEPREVFRSSCGSVCTGDRQNTLEWSPDGKYLLFVLAPLGQPSTIWRIPAAGGEAERIGITMNGDIKMPLMHPDGKSIFFTAAEGDTEVWALENFLPAAPAPK